MTQDDSINEKVERVETIIQTLEDGEVSLERAQALREEGKALVAELREDLDVGDGEIRQVE